MLETSQKPRLMAFPVLRLFPMNPFIPGFSFPMTFNIGSRKKDSDGEKSALPEAVPSTTPAVQTDGGCDVCLDMDQLLMVGVVVSIMILSTAVLVYAARH